MTGPGCSKVAGPGQRRLRFVARGQVQGVGFRPFIFSLAREHALTGFVRNSPRGVVIEVQGKDGNLAAFAHDLEHRLPPLARLTGLTREECELLADEAGFAIAHSSAGSSHSVLISPDVCLCRDCLADMTDPGNRRFSYPFTNCTNCGPRYSITRSIPYDRAFTSMACFPLCPDCQAEYDNPIDRRFHAQPNACPVCGPEVWFAAGPEGRWLPERKSIRTAETPNKDAPGVGAHPRGDAALRALAAFLAGGCIAAIKGLGGFHLACDAGCDPAVAALRQRKNRPHKPFAVMAATLEDGRRIAALGAEEAALLTSSAHPVVICPLLPAAPGSAVSPLVSPDTASVGLMLPYTPLHRVLLDYFADELRRKRSDRPAVLVMTSGNPGGEPICLGNREALAGLGDMADAFLFHNRDILIRVDDSVVRPLPGRGTLVYRRARGYVPGPVRLDSPDDAAADSPVVLGVGAELKNTLCLTKGGDAFVSQHIGDMSTLDTAAFHREIREHLTALLKVQPRVVVRDRHPDYLSSDLAERFAEEAGIPVLRLQHHFAHAHAVLAENRHQGPALVLALDGTGLGEDGGLWGGEALFVDNSGPGEPAHARLAHCAPLALPGGEAAIREPWRIAHALLLRLGLLRATDSGTTKLPQNARVKGAAAPLRGVEQSIGGCVPDPTTGLASSSAPFENFADNFSSFRLPWLPEYADAVHLLPRMLERGLNTPRSTSCGRLFDAVSSLLGLCNAITYEGQAAIRLEEAQHGGPAGELRYPCPFGPSEIDPDLLQLDTVSLFASVWADRQRGTAVPVIARRFHASLAAGLADLTAHLAARHHIRHVGLSGGCFQNVTLALFLADALERKGLVPLLHKELPPGDGCISLGQAVWGRMVVRAGEAGGSGNG